MYTPRIHYDRITAPGANPEQWMPLLHGIYGAGRNWASVATGRVQLHEVRGGHWLNSDNPTALVELLLEHT